MAARATTDTRTRDTDAPDGGTRAPQPDPGDAERERIAALGKEICRNRELLAARRRPAKRSASPDGGDGCGDGDRRPR